MICFGFFQLVIHSICLMLLFAKENCPFDRTVKCDSESDTFSKTYKLTSYVESNGIELQCRSDESHLKAKLDLRPDGDGTHCTTFEFAFRHELPSIFQKMPCYLPTSFSAPVTNKDLWEVTYLCGAINGKGNGVSGPINTRGDTKINFKLEETKLLVPSKHQADIQSLGETTLAFTFDFDNGKLKFEIEDKWIGVNDKNEWVFGTYVMELLDVRLQKNKEYPLHQVVFNSRHHAHRHDNKRLKPHDYFSDIKIEPYGAHA